VGAETKDVIIHESSSRRSGKVQSEQVRSVCRSREVVTSLDELWPTVQYLFRRKFSCCSSTGCIGYIRSFCAADTILLL